MFHSTAADILVGVLNLSQGHYVGAVYFQVVEPLSAGIHRQGTWKLHTYTLLHEEAINGTSFDAYFWCPEHHPVATWQSHTVM